MINVNGVPAASEGELASSVSTLYDPAQLANPPNDGAGSASVSPDGAYSGASYAAGFALFNMFHLPDTGGGMTYNPATNLYYPSMDIRAYARAGVTQGPGYAPAGFFEGGIGRGQSGSFGSEATTVACNVDGVAFTLPGYYNWTFSGNSNAGLLTASSPLTMTITPVEFWTYETRLQVRPIYDPATGARLTNPETGNIWTPAEIVGASWP